jgi:hypothetical protein
VIVRSSKFLLLFLAATLLGAGLFAVAAVWQLSRGPISLAFLTPYIEESLSDGPEGVQVRLHDTVLTWAGLERTLDLRAVGLEIVDTDGQVAASVPELSVQFSLRALLRGLIAPTGLELFGPRLRVARSTDGDIVVGFGAVDANGPSDRGGMQLIGGLLREPDPDSPTGYLRRVSVSSALIEFEDHVTGRTWTAQRADIALQRDDNGIRGEGGIVLDVGEDVAQFQVSGLWNSKTEAAELGITFDNLVPAVAATLDPRLRQLDRFDLPLSGTVALSLAPSLAVENLNFDVAGGAGKIAVPEFYEAPLPVSGLMVRGGGADALNVLVIDEASVDLGGPVATLSGDVARDGDTVEFQLDIRAESVPVNELARLWPPSIETNGRAWITKNIEDGMIESASVSISAVTSVADVEAIELREATGEFEVRDATVHYLRPMTPVANITGLGRFDGVDLLIDITEGAAGDLKVEAGQVTLKDLGGTAPEDSARIELTIAGPTPEALALLDQDPLNFISTFEIDPAQTGGDQVTNVVFKFPLVSALTTEQIDVAAAARLENFSSPAGFFGADVTQGRFDLTVNKQGLVANGEATIADIPVDLIWTENFTDQSALRTRYEVQTVLDDGARETFGLDAEPNLTGPVGVGLTYEIAIDGAEKGAANLNLTDATMSLTDFGWEKPAGQPSTGSVEFTGRNGTINEISKFSVSAPGLSAEGQATLANRGDGLAVSELSLARLVLGETDISLRAALSDDAAPQIVIGGDNLDLRVPIENAFAEDDGKTPAMMVRIDDVKPLQNIRLGNETALQNPAGRLVHDGENWSEIDLKGTLSQGGQIDLRLRTVDSKREFSLVSDDGGAVLRALDWVTTIEGGALRVDGTFASEGEEETVTGKLTLEEFKLNEGPVMARLLSLASFSGIADALAGTGITFRRAEVPFQVTDAEILIGDAKGHGADVGILASGRIDRPSDRIELKGEIAPAYTLNSIFSDIPVLGPLLTGGGDAVFAASYKVEGPIKGPDVSVNPLTVLTPGLLRRLVTGFGEGDGYDEGSTLQPAPQPPGGE